MKFTKKKTDISGTVTGDFYGHAALLAGDAEFQAALALVNAKVLSSNEVDMDVVPLDSDLPFGEGSVREVVVEYGSEAKMETRARIAEAKAYNEPIKAEIAALDAKRLRPFVEKAEGDAEILSSLTRQIEALRLTLNKDEWTK